jgi:tRNA (adenine37-N6)-methyltransferase
MKNKMAVNNSDIKQTNIKCTFQAIGIINSPFSKIKQVPLQQSAATGIRGKIVLIKEFQDGLKGLTGFSHIILLY